jgi:hypothetical protein
MYKANAIIRKVGNKFCVFSKDGKNLGCSNTREGAEKRLKQVEFFKHKGSSKMNYNKAFDNFAKALNEGFTPDSVGGAPDAAPRKVDVHSETLSVADSLRTGGIAGHASDRLLDKKEHFPVFTQTQAQSSMARVMQLSEIPSWYNGTLAELRQEVYAGINKIHPGIDLNVRVSAEMAVALSDGETPAKTSQKSIDDPNDIVKSKVPQVSRPTLTSADVEQALEDEDTRQAIAGRLMEMLDKQLEHMESAKKVGQRLMKTGLKSEEFDQLSTYLQEDILRELMSRGATATANAAEDRRKELLARMNKKGEQ